MKQTTYGTDKNILIAPELAHTIGCIVGNTGVEANAEGKKIIKAGTPVGGTTDVLQERQTVLIVTNNANAETPAASDGKNSQGVVLHDVDVTGGNTNATLVVAGVVDSEKLDITVNAAAKTALDKIIFQAGEDK